MSTFSFNGITKSYVKVARDWSLPAWAPISREYLKVRGRAGVVQVGMEVDERRFELPIIISANSFEEKEALIEEIAEWLILEDDAPLIFSKYPNRTLYAQIEGAPNFPEFIKNGKGTLSVVCADPYKYGEQSIDEFKDGTVMVQNTGTVETPPLYEIEVIENITHLDIISDKSYIRIGEPAPTEEPVYERQTLVLSDSLKTFIGWSDAVEVDNGYVAGTMTATQAGWVATGFGTELSPRKWQGPVKRKSLPRPIQNFQLIADVELLNSGKQTGMIEIYMLDALGNTVAKVGIEDVMQSVAEIQAKFQLGNVQNRKVQHYRTADHKPAWNNYKGVLRLFRDGNRFRPYFSLVQPDGKHVWVASSYLYTDMNNEYSAEITQIQIAIRKWPGTTEAEMKISNLKVWELNDPIEGIPYLANPGDKIIVDTKESVVLLNGEPIQKDFFSDYFDLPKGKTTLLIQPADKVRGKVIVRERFK